MTLVPKPTAEPGGIMNVSITARHCSLTTVMRRRAMERIARLSRFDDRILTAELICEEDRGRTTVEVRLHVPATAPLIAHATADEFRIGLDSVIAKLARQLKRARERRLRHRGEGIADLDSGAAVGV